MPLSEPLRKVADRIIRFYEGQYTPPFLVYVYEPSKEYAVRADLVHLQCWLEADPRGIKCETVSLAEVFWETLEENGLLDMIIEAEHNGAYEEAHLTVRQILASPPTLADRIVGRVSNNKRSAIFLYRTGTLYPAYRTSRLLDMLRDRLDQPVTMLYPGRVVGEYGLSFMGKTDPAYGYRGLIVSRGNQ